MGVFITLEGIDGCGKTTQSRLLAEALERAGHDVVLLREPGGVAISEKIRALLLDPGNEEMGGVCELLLYEAARAQLVHQVIAPALASGKVVVCDRFHDSTTAYQSFAGGLDLSAVKRANSLAVDGCLPDLTIVFDLPPAVACERTAGRGIDRMEAKGMAFQERVAAGFRAIADDEPDRVRIVDAAPGPDEVFRSVASLVSSLGLELA
ncbi:MAG: dTMP kinase [Collinsella sp.]|nr:dTMP kinase [Collinsella sp.]